MKHILKVIEQFEFNHEKNTLHDAIAGSDFKKSQALVEKVRDIHCASERIENIMFGNKEPLKIRIMAIYGLGLITGAKQAKKNIKIDITEF